MKKCILLLFCLLLLPCQALAITEEEFYLKCSTIATTDLTLYSRIETPGTNGETEYTYVPIGTLPAGSYWLTQRGDHGPGMCRINYYSGGSIKEAWVLDGYGRSTTTPVYFINEESTLYVHHYIASNPARLAEYMARMAPGRAYTTIPPWQWDENPPEANVATATPAPASPTDKPASTDAPAATQKPSDSTSATKKPATTKKAKATATPAPTEVPAPEAWLSADWLAENVDADCTERREVGIIRLGVVDSDVTLDGVEYTVPTDALTFADGVKDKHRIAAIYAPRTGRCILRAKASEKAKQLDKCPAGTIVPVLEYGKSWTKIRYNGQAGYVKTAVLTFLGDKDEPIGTGVTSYQGRATGNAQVPVRNGKTSDAEIIVNLRTATEVTVLSFDGKWYEIDHDGWYGFLYKSYFTFGEE